MRQSDQILDISGVDRTVNIAPGVSMLAVLSKLNYKPWFALAEFVDNAVQSAIDNYGAMLRTDGAEYILRVDIDVDPAGDGRITVRDNAAGIARGDFGRAFRPAAVPPDRSGLSEFGMGMKSAACWFARKWSVRTTSIDDSNVYSVHFDVEEIVRDQIEELDISSESATAESHFTEVVLDGLYHLPVKRSLGKIKQHLTDIYRVLTRDNKLDLRFNGEPLVHTPVRVLEAPYFRQPASESVEWIKAISFDFGGGLEVRGFAALREVGSTSNAGFSLFRRGRVIEGSGDEGYRPQTIFGGGNSYRSQRLFGELNLEGFSVSHTKDGFQWDDNEESFLALLKDELDEFPIPLLRQAEGFRKNEPTRSQASATRQAVNNTSQAIEANLPVIIPVVAALESDYHTEIRDEGESGPRRAVSFDLKGQRWMIEIEVRSEPANDGWFTRTINTDEPSSVSIRLRINTAHPFVVRFGQRDSESLEVVLRMATAIAVGETIARQSDVKQAGVVTRNINEVLSRALSGP